MHVVRTLVSALGTEDPQSALKARAGLTSTGGLPILETASESRCTTAACTGLGAPDRDRPSGLYRRPQIIIINLARMVKNVTKDGAIGAKTVTYDFERQMEDATLLKCSEFGEAIVSHM